MTYISATTCRIVAEKVPDEDSGLKFHDSVLGLPLCGQIVRPWKHWVMILIETGEREVDCKRCGLIHAKQAQP